MDGDSDKTMGKGKRELLADFGRVIAVADELAGRAELTEAVTDHVFCDVDRWKVFAVVHHEGVTDEIRSDHAGAGPGFDRLLLISRIEFVDFDQQFLLNKRAFFE